MGGSVVAETLRHPSSQPSSLLRGDSDPFDVGAEISLGRGETVMEGCA